MISHLIAAYVWIRANIALLAEIGTALVGVEKVVSPTMRAVGRARKWPRWLHAADALDAATAQLVALVVAIGKAIVGSDHPELAGVKTAQAAS
jgi:hypothetical protein